MRILLLALACAWLVACGDDDGQLDGGQDAGTDASSPDSSPDASPGLDAGLDAATPADAEAVVADAAPDAVAVFLFRCTGGICGESYLLCHETDAEVMVWHDCTCTRLGPCP
jgi:hypothetical protein